MLAYSASKCGRMRLFLACSSAGASYTAAKPPNAAAKALSGGDELLDGESWTEKGCWVVGWIDGWEGWICGGLGLVGWVIGWLDGWVGE